MREETRRGFLFVPADRASAVMVYAVELSTIAVPGMTAAKARGRADGTVAGLRAKEVARVAQEAPRPGLYKAKLVLHPNAFDAAARWQVVRGAHAGSVLDAIHKLDALARRRPEGRRVGLRALREARRARALADALRRFVLPRAMPPREPARLAEATP